MRRLGSKSILLAARTKLYGESFTYTLHPTIQSHKFKISQPIGLINQKPLNQFFTFIPKVRLSSLSRIADLEKVIADPNTPNDQLLEEVSSLIKLKSSHFGSKLYIGYAQDLQKQGNALFNEGKVPEALFVLQECENSLQSQLSSKNSLSPPEEKCLTLELVDCILMRLQMSDSHLDSSLQDQLESCQNVMKILQRVEEEVSEHFVIALTTQAEILYRLGKIEGTSQSLEKALRLLQEISMNQTNPEILRNLLIRKACCLETFGNLHFDKRNTFDAEKLLLSAMETWHQEIFQSSPIELRNHPLYIRCLNSLGTFYAQCGWTSKAVEILEKAKKLQKNPETDPQGFSWLLLSLAKAYYSRDDYEGSLRLTQEAEKALENSNNEQNAHSSYFRSSLAQVFEHKSTLLTIQGKHSESVAIIDKAISMYSSDQNHLEPIYCRLLFSRAMQHLQAQEYDKAIELALISQNIAKQVRGTQDNQVADALRVIGISFCEKALNTSANGIDIKMFQRGMNYLEQALEIFENIMKDNQQADENQVPTRLHDVQSILQDIANLYEKKKDFKRAIARLENMRCVRMQLLERNGFESDSDIILINTEAKIAALYSYTHN